MRKALKTLGIFSILIMMISIAEAKNYITLKPSHKFIEGKNNKKITITISGTTTEGKEKNVKTLNGKPSSLLNETVDFGSMFYTLENLKAKVTFTEGTPLVATCEIDNILLYPLTRYYLNIVKNKKDQNSCFIAADF